MSPVIVIGIVGSPAGGKSTVAKQLEALGATWINADQLAREVLERGAIQNRLLDHFGADIAGKSGQVDRAKLAAVVFGDDDSSRRALTYLEGLIHPETRRLIELRLDKALQSGASKSASLAQPIVVLDVPLLFEVGWDRCCDQVWCVDADPAVRLQRAAERGWNEGELHRRESNQLKIEEKRRLSNVVIENNGTLDKLHETVTQLWRSIESDATATTDDRHCQP
ncbi:MAG: dephospho-CoA kinase [Planctomycetaceae bacterium]|nr:dephospho-CoA kinase [Planctomycetaceae bacterium]